MSDKQELTAISNSLIQSVDDLARISKMFANSGYFGTGQQLEQAIAQAGVKILAGIGWGIQPFDAMAGIHVIKGKASVGAGIMAAKVANSSKYSYKVHQLDNKGCVIEFFQGDTSLGKSSFLEEDRERAGLSTDVWRKYPANMFFARAMSNGVKWYTPDVFTAPVYTPEELGADVDEDGDVIDADFTAAAPEVLEESVKKEVEKEEVKKKKEVKKKEAKKEEVKKAEVSDITAKQVKELAELIKPLETTREEGLAFIAWVSGKELNKITDLTSAEADMVTAFINQDGVTKAFKQFQETKES